MMAFKLCKSAERRWRKFARPDLLYKLVTGTKFKDGEKDYGNKKTNKSFSKTPHFPIHNY